MLKTEDHPNTVTASRAGGNPSESVRLFERAARVLPGGVSRNTLLYGGPVRYARHGDGCRIIDADGVERLDFSNNVASNIHGHACQPITRAVREQLRHGTAFSMATEAEIQLAELLCDRASGFERIHFVNSGTEAVMAGIKAARAFTGRTMIAKVEGSYHGSYDFAEVSQAPTPNTWGNADCPHSVPLARGTPSAVADETLVLPFNNVEASTGRLDQFKDHVACILVDPLPHRIGMVPAAGQFLQSLRRWASANGTVLLFDEVMTFRNGFGGMQSDLDVVPDLTALGKIIGGGFPVGALAGSADVMAVFVRGDAGMRLPMTGTFSANPVTMTAGYVALSLFDEASVQRLNGLGDLARKNLAEAIALADVPACVAGAGSLLRFHFKPTQPDDYREAYQILAEKQALRAFIGAMYDHGIMLIHTGSAALSTPMDATIIDRLCEATVASLRSIRPLLKHDS